MATRLVQSTHLSPLWKHLQTPYTKSDCLLHQELTLSVYPSLQMLLRPSMRGMPYIQVHASWGWRSQTWLDNSSLSHNNGICICHSCLSVWWHVSRQKTCFSSLTLNQNYQHHLPLSRSFCRFSSVFQCPHQNKILNPLSLSCWWVSEEAIYINNQTISYQTINQSNSRLINNITTTKEPNYSDNDMNKQSNSLTKTQNKQSNSLTKIQSLKINN